jgi:hypothetical protein
MHTDSGFQCDLGHFMSQLSEYEREREVRVRKNMALIDSLGLNNARAAMHEAKCEHSGSGTRRGLKKDASISKRRSGRTNGALDKGKQCQASE